MALFDQTIVDTGHRAQYRSTMSQAGAHARRGPVNLLLADISGSTRMYAVRGDRVAFEVTSTCLNILEEQVEAFGGQVVKRVGDAVLALFENAENAVRSAAAMQNVLESPDCPMRREGVSVRSGLSRGSAVLSKGDVYGDVVNVAARLVSMAGAGEILLAGPVSKALPADMRSEIRLVDQFALRGRPDRVPVYEYLWKRDDTTAPGRARTRGTVTLEVRYHSRVFTVGLGYPRLTIGRDTGNDITVTHKVVSRYHAEITLSGDKFLLTDRSTNGTFVSTDAGDRFRVIRDELVLGGSGQILPGSKALDPIRYRMRRSRMRRH